MKHIKLITAVFLAVLMFVLAPLRTLAENETQYLKEVSIGYGDEGKQKLKDAGYTVYEDLNANEGGKGESVWIGYKTTTVKSEGITDLAVMNMNGGYSISDYQNLISDLKKNVQDKQEQILAAVSEFSKNYAAGSEYAKAAMKLIDCFYYDADENEQIPLKDLFTADELNKDAIYKMCLEGNTDSMDAIVSALSLGLIEYTGKTVVTRLEKTKYGAKRTKTNVAVRAVTEALETLKVELIQAEKTYNVASAYEGGVDAYLQKKESESNIEEAYQIYLYQASKEIKYGNTDLTLWDAMQLPLDAPEDAEESEEITYLDSYMIDMMTNALSLGQIGVIGTVGLGPVLFNAYAVNMKITNPQGTYKSTLDYINESMSVLDGVEKISVFDGVDRSLIEHPEDIAITTEALRQEAKKKETDVGRISEKHWTDGKLKTFKEVMFISIGVTVGAGATAWAACTNSKYHLLKSYRVTFAGKDYHFRTLSDANGFLSEAVAYNPLSKDLDIREASKLFEKQYPELTQAINDNPNSYKILNQLDPVSTSSRTDQLGLSYSKFASNLYVAATTIAAVALVITIIFTVFTFIASKQEEKKKIEYTQVPRAIVDKSTDSNEVTRYVVYYATKQITATEGETDFQKLYGDLNAFNTYDQWLVLYTSKDTTLGEPLTANIMTKDQPTLSSEESAKYLAVHDFGYSAAKNLNYYNTGEEKKNIYVFFERSVYLDDGVASITGTLFNIENAIIAGSSLALGAMVAGVVTFLAMRKKRKKETTV